MIRFISVALFVVIFLILSIPLLIAEWIIGKFNMDIKTAAPWPLSIGRSAGA